LKETKKSMLPESQQRTVTAVKKQLLWIFTNVYVEFNSYLLVLWLLLLLWRCCISIMNEGMCVCVYVCIFDSLDWSNPNLSLDNIVMWFPDLYTNRWSDFHTYIHACMYVCMYACMYACMYVCMYACMYAW
jgi:hypothetical protein